MDSTNNPKISIIVPVYNVEEYLPKCLDSLINQTLKEIEIICINDGSTDKSLQILKKYAEKDLRFVIIDQKNAGVSAARNAGLEKACSEYIMFVDPDDYLEPEACHILYKNLHKTNSDLIIFDYFSVTEQSKKVVSWVKKIDIKEFYFNNAPDEFFYIMTGVIAKIFRKSILNTEFNKNLVKGEDSCFFWLTCLKHNPKITAIKTPLYNYLQRNNSAMTNNNHIKNCEVLKSVEYLINTPEFKNTTNENKFRILDRWLQSIWWELKTCNQKNYRVDKKYIEKTVQIFNYLKNLNIKIKYSKFYKKTKKEIKLQNYNSLTNIIKYIFSITNEEKHKVVKIFGIKLKIKHLRGQYKEEELLIKNLKKEVQIHTKKNYLLFDCLHDIQTECIDAYSLFIYMREQNLNAYYVLRKGTALYNKLKKTQNLTNIIVIDNSPKSYPADFLKAIYDTLLCSKAVITSFGENSSAVGKFFKNTPYFQYIFIQHGQIFIEERTFGTGYLHSKKFNKFLVSSNNELEIFKNNGIAEKNLIKVGLPRWDLLKNKNNTDKSILIMFTWRRLSNKQFEKSEYKKKLIKLLNNKKIEKIAKQYKVKLYFAPHHALACNQQINFQNTAKHIETIDTQYISKYIRECSCLITDFSSVSFDFLYQNKPTLFYVLDKDCKQLSENERKGIINFTKKKSILPNIFTDENELVEKITYYIKKNFELETEIKKQYNEFFYTKENIRKKLIKEIDKSCLENKRIKENY